MLNLPSCILSITFWHYKRFPDRIIQFYPSKKCSTIAQLLRVRIFPFFSRPTNYHEMSFVRLHFHPDWIIFWLHGRTKQLRETIYFVSHKGGILKAPCSWWKHNKQLTRSLLTCTSLHGRTDFSQILRRQASRSFRRRFCSGWKRAVVNGLWTVRSSWGRGIRRISHIDTISRRGRCTHTVVDIRRGAALPRTTKWQQTCFETILSTPSGFWRLFSFPSWGGRRGNTAFTG